MGYFAERTPQPSSDAMQSVARPQPIADPVRDCRRDVERLTGKLSRKILHLEREAEKRGFARGKRAARENQRAVAPSAIRRARLEGRREGIAIGEERARKRFAAQQKELAS